MWQCTAVPVAMAVHSRANKGAQGALMVRSPGPTLPSTDRAWQRALRERRRRQLGSFTGQAV